MSDIKTEGIILKIIPYKDHDRIIQILTHESGMISLLAKGVLKPKLHALLSPLTQLEIVCRKKGSDLFFFKEGFLIENYHFLRTRWELLEAAGRMGGAILQTQLPGKAASRLYQLLTASLKQLPHFEHPATLVVLFYLKLLMHEGVIAWDEQSLFPIPCPNHAWIALKNLALTRSFRPYYQQKGYENFVPQLEKVLKVVL